MHRIRSPWVWLFAIAAAWTACGPSGEAELLVTANPKTIRTDGLDSSLITVKATDENGLVGTGTVHVTSVAGSLADGVDLTLDAYGSASTEYTCNRAQDPACTGDVRIDAQWARAGKSPVQSSGRVTVDVATGTGGSGGSGGGSGGGGGVSCPFVFQLCNTEPDALVVQGRYFGGMANSPMKFFRLASETTATDEFITSTNVVVDSATCTDTNCSRIALRVDDTALDGGVPPSGIQTWDGRGADLVPVSLGGSMTQPTLQLGHYTDGKRSPPVPEQPYFDHNLCGNGGVTEFNICKLDVRGGVVHELLLGFETKCVQELTGARGCVHYTAP